jgi:hypothetical protein
VRRISTYIRARTTPSIIVAIAALVAAMTGGAVAASHQTDAAQDARLISKAAAADRKQDARDIQSYVNAHRSSGLMWINPLDLLPGDPTVHTSFNAVNSGVGGGLSGLIVTADTTGDTSGGGNRVIEKGVDVPPGYDVNGVRVCYEVSSRTTFLDQIRLAQVANPPSVANVLLDDATHQPTPGPVCVNSTSPLGGAPIAASKGGLLLSLRLNFGRTTDKFVLRSLALNLAPA